MLLVPFETYLVLRWASGYLRPPETQAASRVAFQGHYYQVFRHKRTWDEAKRLCEAMGGHLVCITSEGEQEFVLSQLLQLPHLPYSACWLGGTDRDTPGHWRWVTGEELTMTNYLALGDPDEHWLALRFDTGRWDDYLNRGEGVGEQWFMCEWEQ